MNKRPSPPPRPNPLDPPPSNREKMKDALQQMMQQRAEEKASNRADVVAAKQKHKRRNRVRYIQAALVLVVLVVTVVLTLPAWRQPFNVPTGPAAERHAREAVVFAASLVDAYERRTGRLPGNTSQLGVNLPGIIYMTSGESSYVISVRVEGKDLTFRKGDDKARFLAGL